MATKNFVTLENLSLFKDLYDAEMAEAIATAEARSLHTVAISGHTLQFFREEEPVGGATPAYSITLPETDLSGLIPKIANATGGYIAQTKSDGTIEESDTAISDLATNAFVGSIPVGSEATTVIGYVDEQVESVDGAVDDLAEYVGEIPAGATATTVVGYVDEKVDAVEDIADEKTVYIVDNGATSAYAKVYSIYQGSTGSAASPEVSEKLIDINIPKDQVVETGSVVDITFHDSKLWDGATDVTELIKGSGTPTAADAGKYIKLVLQNVTDPLYIAAQSLVDIYTAQSNATSVQLTISNTNEISAVIVDGAVTTAKIADDAVTAAKVSIAAHSETQTAGADGLAISVTTTDGQVSAVSASIAANTYATAAQGALADTALQPDDVDEIDESDIRALFSSGE